MNSLVVLVLTLALTVSETIGFVYNQSKAEICDISISKDVGKPSPLFVYPGTTQYIRAVDTKGRITFNQFQSTLISCPGNGNFVRVKGKNVQEVQAICLHDKIFMIDGVEYNIKELTCQSWPTHVTKASGTCLFGKSLIKIGFEISTGFMEVYETCHDINQSHTYYTRFILGKDAAGAQTGVERSEWIKGNYFSGLDPTNLYKRLIQRGTVGVLLNSTALAEQYISLTSDYFLSKGHMVAKGYFLHGAHQTATFWYLNAAPQWQTFNGKNWNSIENDARKFAGQIKTDLEVYTGTYGRCTLPDVNGNEVDLALTTNNRMPAPRLYWKILYNPQTLAGIAFVGLNNPYQSIESISRDIVCRDICDRVNWLEWEQFNVQKGYSYCCEVNEFRSALPDIPYFPVTSILR